MTDYEAEFQKAAGVCGEPFEEIRTFFEEFDGERAAVLDLGCGQGRDSLLAARKGHRVTAVDIAPTGVRQMLEQARVEGLEIEGHVADITEFDPSGKYDVILLDRVLHMLESDEMRRLVMTTACEHVKDAGFVLIADTPSSSAMIDDFFQSREDWSLELRKDSLRFAQKLIESDA